MAFDDQLSQNPSLVSSYEYYGLITLFFDLEPERMGEESRATYTRDTPEIATLSASDSLCVFVDAETKVSGPAELSCG